MKSVRILRLYPELMSLSGDRGNLLALQGRIHACGVRCDIDSASRGDAMPFADYDLVVACNASLPCLCLAMEDMRRRAGAVAAAVEGGTHFLLTGSARALLGGELRLRSGRSLCGAGVLAESHREVAPFTADVIATRPGLGQVQYIGCYDRALETDAASERPLFQMVRGMGDKPEAIYEGVIKNNLYATYMLGPLLVRNPELLEELCAKLVGEQWRPRRESFDAAAKAAALEELHRRLPRK